LLHVGKTVFKPTVDDREIQWTSALANKILQYPSTIYRLSKPLPVASEPEQFVFKEWSASSFLSGTAEPVRFEEIIRVSRSFHADTAELMHEKPKEIIDNRIGGARQTRSLGKRRLSRKSNKSTMRFSLT
jgi:hypothetical protein